MAVGFKDGDGRFIESFELDVVNTALFRAENYKFDLAGEEVTQAYELGKRGWKIDYADADESYSVLSVDGDTFIVKTEAEYVGAEFDIYVDRDGDGLWSKIAEGETTGDFLHADGSVDLVGIVNAGLLIAETDYHAEVESIIEPFKGLALGVFLLTVGMSLDLALVVERLGEILLATTLVLAAKALVTGLLLRLHGYRTATATEAGILLSSPSETTLIVLTSAVAVNLIRPEAAQFWQIVTALGLTITPLLAVFGRWLAHRVDQAGAEQSLPDDGERERTLIIGGGRVGRLVADMLTAHDKPYLILDADPDQVRETRKMGFRVEYADAAQSDALSRFDA